MKTDQKRLEWFQSLKFGLMIHWGIYSHAGITESWPLCSEKKPWCVRPISNYVQFCREYRELAEKFNPVDFDPDEWAEQAARAGMKYVVFTTKHHDGFCMFDTKTTDFKITHQTYPFHNQPYSDVTKALADSFRKQGLAVGFYFSKADWNHNDYWAEDWAAPNRYVNYNPDEFPHRWKQFVDFTHQQIDELISNYGKIDILWLDAAWVRKKQFDKKNKQPFTEDIQIRELVRSVKEKQPHVLFVDRFGDPLCEDYYTPENTIPAEPVREPWESCMTMGNSWSYQEDDQYKSTRQLISNFLDILSKGGNLLLNIGPDGRGKFPEPAVSRLKEIGEWMTVNKKAVEQAGIAKKNKDSRFYFVNDSSEHVYAFFQLNQQDKIPHKIMVYDYCPEPGETVFILGKEDQPLLWEKIDENTLIYIPDSIIHEPPCRFFITFYLGKTNQSS